MQLLTSLRNKVAYDLLLMCRVVYGIAGLLKREKGYNINNVDERS